jgi:hypothetical protein
MSFFFCFFFLIKKSKNGRTEQVLPVEVDNTGGRGRWWRKGEGG